MRIKPPECYHFHLRTQMSVSHKRSLPPRPGRRGLTRRGCPSIAHAKRVASHEVLDISNDSNESQSATAAEKVGITVKVISGEAGTERRGILSRSGNVRSVPVKPTMIVSGKDFNVSLPPKSDLPELVKLRNQELISSRLVVGTGAALTVTCPRNSEMVSDVSRDPVTDGSKNNFPVTPMTVTVQCGGDDSVLLADRTIDLVTPAPNSRFASAYLSPITSATTPSRFYRDGAIFGGLIGPAGSFAANPNFADMNRNTELVVVAEVQKKADGDSVVVKRRRLADGGFPGVVVACPSAWVNGFHSRDMLHKRAVRAVRPNAAVGGTGPDVTAATAVTTSENRSDKSPDVIILDTSPARADVITIDSPNNTSVADNDTPATKTVSDNRTGSSVCPIVIEEVDQTSPAQKPISPTASLVQRSVPLTVSPACLVEPSPRFGGVACPTNRPPARTGIWEFPRVQVPRAAGMWADGRPHIHRNQYAGANLQIAGHLIAARASFPAATNSNSPVLVQQQAAQIRQAFVSQVEQIRQMSQLHAQQFQANHHQATKKSVAPYANIRYPSSNGLLYGNKVLACITGSNKQVFGNQGASSTANSSRVVPISNGGGFGNPVTTCATGSNNLVNGKQVPAATSSTSSMNLDTSGKAVATCTTNSNRQIAGVQMPVAASHSSKQVPAATSSTNTVNPSNSGRTSCNAVVACSTSSNKPFAGTQVPAATSNSAKQVPAATSSIGTVNPSNRGRTICNAVVACSTSSNKSINSAKQVPAATSSIGTVNPCNSGRTSGNVVVSCATSSNKLVAAKQVLTTTSNTNLANVVPIPAKQAVASSANSKGLIAGNQVAVHSSNTDEVILDIQVVAVTTSKKLLRAGASSGGDVVEVNSQISDQAKKNHKRKKSTANQNRPVAQAPAPQIQVHQQHVSQLISVLGAPGMLRPIAIDGSNVAFCHGKDTVFSCRGVEICINYFLQRGHTAVKAFVPQHRRSYHRDTHDRNILERLHRAQQHVVFTPSRLIDGRLVTSYDDRFVFEYAQQTGAVVVSNDHFRDLAQENTTWKQIINTRLLMYTFADDVFMVPSDPLGRTGPNLDIFLRF